MKKKRVNPKVYLRRVEKDIAIVKKRLTLPSSFSCRREYYDAVGAFQDLYTMYLEVAQIRHRYSLGDAQQPLADACELAERLAALWLLGNALKDAICPNGKLYTAEGEKWATLPKRIDDVYFRFGTAAILSLLVHDRIPPVFHDVVPVIKSWNSAEVVFPLNYPDAGLLHLLASGKKPSWWQGMIAFLGESYGNSLLPETMECYADIVLACRKRDWQRAIAAVGVAETLYERRADEWYEEFEPWEGSGEGNALSIDLRLAALMRHCFRDNPKALSPLQSIHRWA